MTPRDPSLTALLDASGGTTAFVNEAARHYFQTAHPAASSGEVCSAAVAVVYYATDGETVPGANPALELWLYRVLDRLDLTDDALAVALIDALVFLPRPGSDAAAAIREAVDILVQTKHTFKSHQLARVRKILEALI